MLLLTFSVTNVQEDVAHCRAPSQARGDDCRRDPSAAERYGRDHRRRRGGGSVRGNLQPPHPSRAESRPGCAFSHDRLVEEDHASLQQEDVEGRAPLAPPKAHSQVPP